MAIKYGITLGNISTPEDYFSAEGDLLWKADNKYQNDIIGIGRDDKSTLHQKQSHQKDDSMRIYLGDLTSTNANNTSDFSMDKSFVLMGSNDKQLNATDASNAAMYTGLNGQNCNFLSVIERKWKIYLTNMKDTFNIDIKLNDLAKLNLINQSDLRLIVDTDDDLSNGWEACHKTDLSKKFEIRYDSQKGIVTIMGINDNQIPGDGVRYISLGSVDKGTPLPIALSSFDAHCENQITELCWTTASETNNDYFTIEKSIDGNHFREIATIEGQGNKTTKSGYHYRDYEKTVGLTYYRLSQTDFDGEKTFLETISSNCEGEIEVMLHPNPTQNGVFVSLNGKVDQPFDIAVYNVLGEQVINQSIEGSTWIELPDENGIYLFKYIVNKKKHVNKVVKY